MDEYALKPIDNDADKAEEYSKLCIPPNQPQCIRVQITLPSNNILSTNFALWDTILDVKHYILPEIQPKIKNIQQIKCVVYNTHQLFEVSNHTLLKHYWNKFPLNILVSIENHEDIKETPNIQNNTTHHVVHPEYGNILDTNLIMPRRTLGYRNKKNGILYKNATIQTVPENTNNQSIGNKISLAIQTTEKQDTSTDRVIDFGTQTETINVLRRLNVLKELTTRQNTILEENFGKYARVIQKFVRSWMTRKKFERMLQYYNHLKQLTLDEEKTMKTLICTRQKQALINLQYPIKPKDFEALYSEINIHYKNKKNHQINKSPKSIQTENKINLKEKMKCLREIIKHRNQLNKRAAEKKQFKELNEISQPITMTRKNGKTISIETPETRKAQQFMELYITLKNNDLSKNERIEFIQKLLDFLGRFKELDLTKIIIYLLNQEITMLDIVHPKSELIKKLRKRIEVEFQMIMKQPEINPAVKRRLKPVIIYKCYNCRKMKPLNRFVVSLDLTKIPICVDCKHLYRIAIEQINLGPYIEILKDIKATEMKLFAKSILVFSLNKEDIYYLVKVVWMAKSAVSEITDLTRLTMVRWCNNRDWSPSNTILLTMEEASVHTKIDDVNKVYTSTFIDRINLKHMQAKRYFNNLTQNLSKIIIRKS
ncbi:IQ motif, EF-hand binding site [Cinara cedri]|uniref:IQ motif, EF-hand binding site n=1 Tax=Cinara cedri TaxID=506608 RepID=A0A5E4N492_9HEMI|nr:IQ motif, EF-hand binding site [Cinara cedri]